MCLHKFNSAINHLSKMKCETQLYENLTIDMVCAICVCLCIWFIYSTTMMPLNEQRADVVIQLNIEAQLIDVVFEWKRLLRNELLNLIDCFEGREGGDVFRVHLLEPEAHFLCIHLSKFDQEKLSWPLLGNKTMCYNIN